jgi:hypothetical protein
MIAPPTGSCAAECCSGAAIAIANAAAPKARYIFAPFESECMTFPFHGYAAEQRLSASIFSEIHQFLQRLPATLPPKKSPVVAAGLHIPNTNLKAGFQFAVQMFDIALVDGSSLSVLGVLLNGAL